MTYRRFLREAEPYKISACGSCDAKLRRSRFVYLYLLFMCVGIAAITTPLILIMLTAHIPMWLVWLAVIGVLGCWALFTNYLAWRLIGWVSVED